MPFFDALSITTMIIEQTQRKLAEITHHVPSNLTETVVLAYARKLNEELEKLKVLSSEEILKAIPIFFKQQWYTERTLLQFKHGLSQVAVAATRAADWHEKLVESLMSLDKLYQEQKGPQGSSHLFSPNFGCIFSRTIMPADQDFRWILPASENLLAELDLTVGNEIKELLSPVRNKNDFREMLVIPQSKSHRERLLSLFPEYAADVDILFLVSHARTTELLHRIATVQKAHAAAIKLSVRDSDNLLGLLEQPGKCSLGAVGALAHSDHQIQALDAVKAVAHRAHPVHALEKPLSLKSIKIHLLLNRFFYELPTQQYEEALDQLAELSFSRDPDPRLFGASDTLGAEIVKAWQIPAVKSRIAKAACIEAEIATGELERAMQLIYHSNRTQIQEGIELVPR